MSQEATRTVTVGNAQGLHLRPAQQLANLASQFQCRVTLTKDGTSVDAKSILNIITLAAEHGSELQLTTDGDDAQQALEALADLLENGHPSVGDEVAG
jgi:phosphotransferase system HPr (HPr) family protein